MLKSPGRNNMMQLYQRIFTRQIFPSFYKPSLWIIHVPCFHVLTNYNYFKPYSTDYELLSAGVGALSEQRV